MKTAQAIGLLLLLSGLAKPPAQAAAINAALPEWIALQPDSTGSFVPQTDQTHQDGEMRVVTTFSGLWLTRRVDLVPAVRATRDDISTEPLPEHFDSLSIPGFTHLQVPGLPRLPAAVHFFPVPRGVQPDVAFIPRQKTRLDDLRILPMQEFPPDVYPAPPPAPFALDQAIYSSAAPFPADPLFNVQLITIREQPILRVVVSPFQTYPADGTVDVIHDYELLVSWEPLQAAPPPAPQPDGSAPPIYMILTANQYAGNNALLQLAEWKKRKGFDTRIVTTSDIHPSGTPANSQIVAYMRGLPEEDYPDYLLIIGHHDQTNGVAGAYFNTYTTDYFGYTDLDIACRTASDIYPDLYHGRLPGTNQNEITAMIDKILLMDRTPPTNAMYQRVCVAGQIQDSDNNDNIADRLFCETADAISSYFEKNTGGFIYSSTRAIVNPDGMTATGRWNSSSILWNSTNEIGTRIHTQFVSVAVAQSRITSQVNSGLALLQHRDHGYVNGVGWGDPFYIYTHVNALTNGTLLPVVFSINCNSGMYNFPNNFAKAWLTRTNGGAYAVFAPVDTSYSWYNDWLTHGFYAGFLGDYISAQNTSVSPEWPKKLPEPGGTYGASGSAPNLGQILNFGKFYMAENFWLSEDTFRLFHLFGDPESQLRIKTPQPNAVSHPASIQIATTAFTVTVASAQSTVCLYGPGLGIHAVATPVAGKAVFPLTLTNTGTLYITVTGIDLIPYEDQIRVYHGDAPFSFNATPLAESVMLRWTDPQESGQGTSIVRIRASTSGYPPSPEADRLVHQGDTSPFLDTNLLNSTTYYYSIWVTDDGVTFVEP